MEGSEARLTLSNGHRRRVGKGSAGIWGALRDGTGGNRCGSTAGRHLFTATKESTGIRQGLVPQGV